MGIGTLWEIIKEYWRSQEGEYTVVVKRGKWSPCPDDVENMIMVFGEFAELS